MCDMRASMFVWMRMCVKIVTLTYILFSFVYLITSYRQSTRAQIALHNLKHIPHTRYKYVVLQEYSFSIYMHKYARKSFQQNTAKHQRTYYMACSHKE